MRDDTASSLSPRHHKDNEHKEADDDDSDDDATMKPPSITASPSWPCANCQTTVSTERCPTCHGVQVRILDNQKDLTGAWLERLSPAIFRRTGTPTPEGEAYEFRPLDPVACILASAPSPIVDEKKVVALKEIEDRLRLRKRPLVKDLQSGPKKKWLSAV